MTMERAELSGSLPVGQTTPVSPASTVQGQASPENGEGKARRHPPAPEEAAAEAEEAESPEDDADPPRHRIDSLA